MIKKKIKALKDIELKTFTGFHCLVEGEVKEVEFENQRVFKSHLKFGGFVEADEHEKESKNIPIILPEVEETPKPEEEAPPPVEPGTADAVIIGDEVSKDDEGDLTDGVIPCVSSEEVSTQEEQIEEVATPEKQV